MTRNGVNRSMKFKKLLATVVAVCVSAAAMGDDTLSSHTDHGGHAGHIIEEVVVIGHPLSGEGFSQAVEVLVGDELERKAADSIGATVGNQPGVHNSSFGAAVGRPVIHGLDGARVRVMEDRIDTMDVSVTGSDHVTTVEPYIANGVEILKGSGTLLYGSGAIGGVVDVHTGRIPHDATEGVNGKFDLRAGDNGDGRNGSFRLDGGAGRFAWHVDGFAREADDYEIPGFVESARLRAMEEAHDEDDDHHDDGDDHDEDEGHDEDEDHEEEHKEEEEAHGMVPGSGLDVYGGAAGFSFVGDNGFIGASVSHLDAEYGIPGHGALHAHDDVHEEEEHGSDEEHHDDDDEHELDAGHGEEDQAYVDMEQTRIDFEAALNEPFRGAESLNLRVGINDYEHQEVESSGEVGTAFENDAWEARLELTHKDLAGWHGVVGAQYADRSVSIVGEEAFTPPVDTTSLGLFWVGERDFPGFQLEAGARFDNVEHEPATGGSETFSTFSASMGAVVPIGDSWTGTMLVDYSSRAPVGEELYSNGPHLATRSFEVGDRNLDEEKAFDLSARLAWRSERGSLEGTFYYTKFSDFIFQVTTGEEKEELTVREFSQADATFVGFDFEAAFDLLAGDWGHLQLSGLFDTVTAELDVDGNDNLPRIPPDRAGLGLELTVGRFAANLDYVRAFKQHDIGELELETDAYDDLRAYAGWDLTQGVTAITVYLQGRNLTDAEQRKHTSFVKDLLPEPGRTIEAGIRVRF